jgi:hypothetical protein
MSEKKMLQNQRPHFPQPVTQLVCRYLLSIKSRHKALGIQGIEMASSPAIFPPQGTVLVIFPLDSDQLAPASGPKESLGRAGPVR